VGACDRSETPIDTRTFNAQVSAFIGTAPGA